MGGGWAVGGGKRATLTLASTRTLTFALSLALILTLPLHRPPSPPAPLTCICNSFSSWARIAACFARRLAVGRCRL